MMTTTSMRPSNLSLLVLLVSALLVTTAHGAEKCSDACPKNIAPVCASDGQTYDNKCLFEYAKCSSNSTTLTISKQGECDASGTGSNAAGKCNAACPKIMAPVCASNGKTYDNKCLFEYAKCSANDSKLTIASQGKCSASGSGSSAGSNSTCNANCVAVEDPVCGSDGKTYSNECRLEYARCSKQSPNVKVASKGKCSGSQTGSKGSHASSDSCTNDCTRERVPVCGSDGKTYDNACLLKYAACSKGSITKVSDGECAGGPTRSNQNASSNSSTAPTPTPTKSQSARLVTATVPTIIAIVSSVAVIVLV